MPYSANSSLASLSLALARITNIDKRLSVAASRSRLQISKISLGLRLKPIKLACIRPLADKNAAKRASFRPSRTKSWVNWPCKNLAASSPSARMTPRWFRGAMPSRFEVMAEL